MAATVGAGAPRAATHRWSASASVTAFPTALVKCRPLRAALPRRRGHPWAGHASLTGGLELTMGCSHQRWRVLLPVPPPLPQVPALGQFKAARRATNTTSATSRPAGAGHFWERCCWPLRPTLGAGSRLAAWRVVARGQAGQGRIRTTSTGSGCAHSWRMGLRTRPGAAAVVTAVAASVGPVDDAAWWCWENPQSGSGQEEEVEAAAVAAWGVGAARLLH